MTTEIISPVPKLQFFDNNGLPLTGGKLFIYIAGTTTKTNTYTDSTGTTPNSNPIILNTRGEASVWLTPGNLYKFVLSPSTDTDPPTNAFYTVDNIAPGDNLQTTLVNPNLVYAGPANPAASPAYPTFRNSVGADFNVQSPNYFLVGPSSGTTSNYPTFRAITAADISGLVPPLSTSSSQVTWYVNASTGNDSYNGLSATFTGSGVGPFLTIQRAITAMNKINLNGFTASINIANGTYAPFSVTYPPVGGTFTITGNTSSPSSVIVQSTTGSPAANFNSCGPFNIGGMTFGVTGAPPGGTTASTVQIEFATVCFVTGAIQFNSSTLAYQLGVSLGASLLTTSSSSTILFNGSSTAALIATAYASTCYINSAVILSGTFTFSTATVYAQYDSIIAFDSSSSISGGTVTGTRYLAQYGAIIKSQSGSATFFPGSTAGSTTPGGQYY